MAKDNPLVFGYVYLVRNRVNGKIYIGKTTQSISIRWIQHCSPNKNKAQSRLHNAIRKYGREQFDVVELGRAFSEHELNDMETRAIYMADSTNRTVGYNITCGGDGAAGIQFSAEAREKIRAASKRRWSNPDFKAAMGAQRTDRYASSEAREKQRTATLRFCRTPEYKAVHQANTSRLWTSETYREAQREGMARVRQSEEYLAKQSASSKARWSDPVWRAEQMEKRRAYWASPENRAKAAAKRSIKKERQRKLPVLQVVTS